MSLPLSIASERSLKVLQLSTRALFALLVAVYFAGHPELFKPLAQWMIWILLAFYLLIQGFLTLRPLPVFRGESLTAGVDLLALAALLIVDPGTPPPLLALLAVAVLSAGLIHGLRRFLYTLGAAIVVVVPALFLRVEYREQLPDAATVFLLATLGVCLLYFALMLYRNHVLARLAEEATWQDRETGLISREALVHTGSWLLPLHDRLSADLTVVLLTCDSRARLLELGEQVHQRLRRSDVAARHDEQSLALMLPCTGTTEAGELLGELERRVPGMRGAMIRINDPDIALEQVLNHLQATVARARPKTGQWLVHASRLSPA